MAGDLPLRRANGQKDPAEGEPAAGSKEGKETEREEIVSPHVEDGVRIPGKFEINLDFL